MSCLPWRYLARYSPVLSLLCQLLHVLHVHRMRPCPVPSHFCLLSLPSPHTCSQLPDLPFLPQSPDIQVEMPNAQAGVFEWLGAILISCLARRQQIRQEGRLLQISWQEPRLLLSEERATQKIPTELCDTGLALTRYHYST